MAPGDPERLASRPVAAFLALWRYKIGVIPVIAACALAGLGNSLLI